MKSLNLNQENSSRKAGQGPGDRLQAARTEQGMSLEDVATSMHLSIGILEAIEENNFDDITAPIFVKGYLRAYARIVSLDEDEMIQQYLDYYSDEDPPIHPTSNMDPQISSDDARIKWFTSLVIIGLIGLFTAWWWNQYQIKTDVISLDAERIDALQETEAVNNPVTSHIEIVPDTPINLDEGSDVVPLAVDELEVTKLSVGESQEEANLESTQLATEIAGHEETTLQEDTVDLEVNTEEISRMAPMGTELLKITIHADTWVDVEDANGHRLVYELLRADQKYILTGQAPFAVFLGNGHGAELIYNDEIVEITSRIRDNNTVRLTIGN